ERVRLRVEGREAVQVRGDGAFLVACAHQVVEHRRLRRRQLLIEQPRLARVERRAERGALGGVRELSQGDEKLDVELADAPQLAASREEGDAELRQRIEVFAP